MRMKSKSAAFVCSLLWIIQAFWFKCSLPLCQSISMKVGEFCFILLWNACAHDRTLPHSHRKRPKLLHQERMLVEPRFTQSILRANTIQKRKHDASRDSTCRFRTCSTVERWGLRVCHAFLKLFVASSCTCYPDRGRFLRARKQAALQ